MQKSKAKMVTVQNEYYLRTILLLCEGGSYIAKLIISRELPKFGDDLDILLKNVESKLRHEFHKKQIEKLFPNDGYGKTDVNKWDIQMLVGVILLLFRTTLSKDEKQKLREIKLIRHEVLAHCPSASLYVEKYEDVKEQLEEAINELASRFDQGVKDKCKSYISIYATHSLDVASAIKRLQEAKDTDDLFHEVIRVIKRSQDDLSNQIQTAEGNIRKDLKDTEQILTTELKTLEGCVHKEVKDVQKTLSGDLKSVDSTLKASEQTLLKEIVVVSESVTSTQEKLVEQMKILQKKECSTYQAMTDVSSEIKYMRPLLEEMWAKLKCRSDKTTASTEFQDLSEKLKLKSEEVNNSILTYDETTSQPYERVSTTKNESNEVYTRYNISKPKLVVAAIDFGSTYSGCAFSFTSNPLRISVEFGATHIYHSFKTPTAVLFYPNRQFHSFGYEAEDHYSDLADEDKHTHWYYFTRFKMVLYTEKVDRNMDLEDDNGKKMKATQVFSSVIRYFKNNLIKTLASRGIQLESSDVQWVLTVPAIWNDKAKQFMREAAFEAEIDVTLKIALEPEAASIYCQTISETTKGPDDSKLACIRSGMKYMVIDLGGGTADITVHEKQTDGRLRELHRASGGAWGGTMVDKEIIGMITAVFGKETFSEFSKNYIEDYLDLQRDIENTKRKERYPNDWVMLRLPMPLLEIIRSKQNLKISIANSGFSGKIECRKDRLRIKSDAWVDLFKPCCHEIIKHISEILSHPSVQGTSVLLMVGGFSACTIVQDSIKLAFPRINVIIPEQPEVAVLKGAVISGHRPLAIMSRVSKYTYGISISPLFDSSIHPESRRVNIGGKNRCRDVFMKYISAGENVRVGDARSGEHATLWPHQKEVVLKMYVSATSNPMYVDEKGTEYLGKVVVQVDDRKEESIVWVKMMFGETEFMVEATDLSRGTKHSAHFDFLV